MEVKKKKTATNADTPDAEEIKKIEPVFLLSNVGKDEEKIHVSQKMK